MDLAVNGTRLWVEREGEGPPVLLLHGFPETHRSWDLQVPFLVQHGYSVLRPDLRGYGRSARPETGYDLGTLAGDVAELIQKLGLAPVRLAGHDWGGGITWEVATRFPELVERICVLACPHPVLFAKALRTNRRQMRRSWYIAFFQLPRLPERWLTKNGGEKLAKMFREGSPGRGRAPKEIVEAARTSLASSEALRGPLAYYRSAFRSGARRPPTAAAYPKIEAPLTLIWGEADSCLGMELMDGTERFVEDLEIRVVSDAGHFVHQESADEVNDLLLRALA